MQYEIETTKTLVLFAPQTLYEFIETFDWSLFDFPISDFLQFRKTVNDYVSIHLQKDDEYTQNQKREIIESWSELAEITRKEEFDNVLIRRQI